MATKKDAPEQDDGKQDVQDAPAVTESAQPAAAPAAAFAPVAPDDLVLGQSLYVTVQPGVVLRNSETGLPFVPGAATQQIVTAATIRRLRDGDLQQVPAPAA